MITIVGPASWWALALLVPLTAAAELRFSTAAGHGGLPLNRVAAGERGKPAPANGFPTPA
jgi:hypothetical protein